MCMCVCACVQEHTYGESQCVAVYYKRVAVCVMLQRITNVLQCATVCFSVHGESQRGCMQFILPCSSDKGVHAHVHTYKTTNTHTHNPMPACTHAQIHIYKHPHTKIDMHTCIHTYARTHVNTLKYTYIHTYINAYIQTYSCLGANAHP